jgi:hypothetical protein
MPGLQHAIVYRSDYFKLCAQLRCSGVKFQLAGEISQPYRRQMRVSTDHQSTPVKYSVHTMTTGVVAKQILRPLDSGASRKWIPAKLQEYAPYAGFSGRLNLLALLPKDQNFAASITFCPKDYGTMSA